VSVAPVGLEALEDLEDIISNRGWSAKFRLFSLSSSIADDDKMPYLANN
jgi:hypothetical protein